MAVLFYLVLFVLGTARASTDPAGQALLPFLVPAGRLPRVIAQGSSAWQVAVITGPALGGLAYGCGPTAPYGMCAVGFLFSALAVAALGGRRTEPAASGALKDRISRVAEGIAFVWSEPIVLGAVSLDLFAVLLGSTTALLPIYARDILHVGPAGLGLLRSAPAAGACLIALTQTHHPPDRHVGLKLYATVALFGIATLIFAFSVSFILSLAALVIVGASGMVIRPLHTSGATFCLRSPKLRTASRRT